MIRKSCQHSRGPLTLAESLPMLNMDFVHGDSLFVVEHCTNQQACSAVFPDMRDWPAARCCQGDATVCNAFPHLRGDRCVCNSNTCEIVGPALLHWYDSALSGNSLLLSFWMLQSPGQNPFEQIHTCKDNLLSVFPTQLPFLSLHNQEDSGPCLIHTWSCFLYIKVNVLKERTMARSPGHQGTGVFNFPCGKHDACTAASFCQKKSKRPL